MRLIPLLLGSLPGFAILPDDKVRLATRIARGVPVFLSPEADQKSWHIHDLLTEWFPFTSNEWSITVVLQRKEPLGATPETDANKPLTYRPSRSTGSRPMRERPQGSGGPRKIKIPAIEIDWESADKRKAANPAWERKKKQKTVIKGPGRSSE